jgi:hypothetical protein
MKYEVLKVGRVPHHSCDWHITVRMTTEPFWWFTKPETFVRTYRGDCTVWHDAHSGKRANCEHFLADVWTKANWEEKDAKNLARSSVHKLSVAKP